jgi:hypothetical protein
LLLLAGCPGKRANADAAAAVTPGTSTQQASAGQPAQLVIVCSATESDEWTRELLVLTGSKLGFDVWAQPSTSGHLDIYGPYDGSWHGEKLQATILFTGMTTVAELIPQQALGSEAREWLAQHPVDYLWLDGDPVQLQIGAVLDDAPPIIFTGVVNDRELYYRSSGRVTGVYHRHSLAGVLGVVWALDPVRFKDASIPRHYALITDDSPSSISRASRYAKWEGVLPDGHTWIATPAAHSWQELRKIVQDMQTRADALIFCGVGEPNCNADFTNNPPPADLLKGNQLPAVVLGPSRMDQCGATVLTVKTGAAVDEALERLGKLMDGESAESMGLVEPREMSMYRAAGEDEAAVEAKLAGGPKEPSQPQAPATK